MKKLTLILFLGVAPALLGQQPASPPPTETPLHLTLNEAFERALGANPSLLRARAEIDIAEQQRKLIRSLVLPHISANGSVIENSTEVQFGSGSDSRTILPRQDWNYRVQLTQPIWAGFRDQKAYSQARLLIDNARLGAQSTEDQLLVRVAADYLGVVEGDAVLAVEGKNIEIAERRRKQARDFYEAGETTQVDVLRADSAIKAAQRRLALARQQRDTAEGRLRIDLGIDRPIVVDAKGIGATEVPGEAGLLERAEAGRPELRVASNNLKAAHLEVLKQRGAYYPVVSADAAFINQKSSFPASRYNQAALRVSVPIFDSGEIGHRVAIARDREEQARLSLEEARQGVREEVRKALLDVTAARTTLALAREQLAAVQAEYEQIFELYRSQEATSLEAQSAETDLAEARRAVVTGELDVELAELRALYSAGSIRNAAGTEDR